MNPFKVISPDAADEVFRLIGKEWMLITAEAEDENGNKQLNTMTASWGGLGILWNKPVAFLFIRPQRHTFSLTERAARFSLSFLGDGHREALRLCGTKSGRDIDKFAASGLTPAYEQGVPYVKEARLVLLGRKLYADDLKKSAFVLPELLQNYAADDYHKMYILEIEHAMVRE